MAVERERRARRRRNSEEPSEPEDCALLRLLRLSTGIDRVTTLIGRAVAWLILAAVLVSAANAILRKSIDLGLPAPLLRWYVANSNAALELQWYLFSAVFLLAAAWTLQRNEHIRIDIASALMPKRLRDWIDLLGHLLMLMPFVGLMIYEAIPYLGTSWRLQERSANAGGLLLWPAKALIVAGFSLLFLQGVSEIIKRVAVMRGAIPDRAPEHRAPPEVEEQLPAGSPPP
jgi:TRAP-type mannitol/chloroaromatic compound transport system permease small subunit